jgi:hypothetical protein
MVLMYKKIIYTNGQKIRECTFIQDVYSRDTHNRRARFECHCGNLFVANISNVKNGNTQGCGCRGNGYIGVGHISDDYIESVGRGWNKVRLLHCFGFKTEVLKSGKIRILENSYFDHQLIGVVYLATIKKSDIFNWLKKRKFNIKR